MQGVANEREEKERNRAQQEDRGDGIGRVLFVGVDRALRRDDSGDPANRRSYGQQAYQLGLEFECAAQVSHECKGQGEFNGNKEQRDAAQATDIAEEKSRPEQDNPSLQPEFVGCYPGTKNRRNANGIRNHQADEDSPENIFDVG